VQLGNEIAAMKPDIIFLSTPHGIAVERDFLFYENRLGAGYALLGQDLPVSANFTPYIVDINVTMAANVTAALLEALSRDCNVTGLMSFADSEPERLGWGEVIPLSFLSATLATSQVVVLSQPLRRYTEARNMGPELLALGGRLYALLDGLEATVAVVVSCDLAHTHLASGPYGFSPAAEPFDLAVGEWAATLNSAPLLETATGLVDAALSCGFTGLVLLHGLLTAAPHGWATTLLADRHPTYYGMMVASFYPTAPTQADSSVNTFLKRAAKTKRALRSGY
jgi:aromatic ring-opening dioxygenase LigB subunit